MGQFLTYFFFGTMAIAGVFVGREVAMLFWSQLRKVGLWLERGRAYEQLGQRFQRQADTMGWALDAEQQGVMQFAQKSQVALPALGQKVPFGAAKTGSADGEMLLFSLEIEDGALWTRCALSCPKRISLELSILPSEKDGATKKDRWLRSEQAVVDEESDEFPAGWSASPTYFTYASVVWDDRAIAPGARVEGTEEELLALWDHEHYERLGQLFQAFGFEVQHCTILYRQPGLLDEAESQLLIERIMEFAALLTLPEGNEAVLARLAANVRAHRILEVRQRSLELLQLLAPVASETIEISRHALVSLPRPCQVTAALFLGAEGLDFLRPLLIGHRLPPAVEPAIWGRVRELYDPKAVSALLRDALREYMLFDRSPSQIREATLLTHLAEHEGEGAMAFFDEFMDDAVKYQRHRAVESITRIYGLYGDSQREARLWPLLQYKDLDVPRSAAQALGRLGTPASIRYLAAAKKSALSPHAKVFQDAINAIQMRYSHLEAGQLALVDDHTDGELSIAGTEQHEGAVTVFKGNEDFRAEPENERE